MAAPADPIRATGPPQAVAPPHHGERASPAAPAGVPDPVRPAGLPDPVGSAALPRQPRRRIVLAEVARRGADHDRTRTELTEQTRVGEALVRGLVRAQLALALRLALVVAIGLGGLPLLFTIAPAVSTTTLLGVNLPWLLLGAGAFPFLVSVGWTYVHLAERNEHDFIALVQRPER